MKHKINLETLKEIARVSKSLSASREELERYYKEEYLNETKDRSPWITVRIANHPTYLKDFTVSINDDDLRNSIVKITIQQTKISIKKLEEELEELLKQAEIE